MSVCAFVEVRGQYWASSVALHFIFLFFDIGSLLELGYTGWVISYLLGPAAPCWDCSWGGGSSGVGPGGDWECGGGTGWPRTLTKVFLPIRQTFHTLVLSRSVNCKSN